MAGIEAGGPQDQGLRQYLRLIARTLGVDLESCWYECDPDATAYIALDQRVPRHPDHDLALLWDEHTGWCAGIEVGRGADLLPLTYLGPPVLPPPEAVTVFVSDLVAGRPPDRPEPPAMPAEAHLGDLLVEYADHAPAAVL
ncbi:DUF6292 family protein [Actinosynnema sp. NPDC053489]|uniref:DUF6292 family protein n=1 Tax=Actinosynnema sp. NPDC053489 TaxID=3363916 RepID=UPI0037C8B7BD